MSLARRAQSSIPARLVLPTKQLYLNARRRFFRGDAVHCPCCDGHWSRFLDAGSPARPAACPGCDSRERQRLLYLYLRDRTDLFKGGVRLLHIAPEECLQSSLTGLPAIDYVSADMASSAAMMRMDITDIPFPADSVDVILCSHVLEHVNDDRRAMRELCRVLKPGGWAILQVPLDRQRSSTYEDMNITAPAERERLFGQWDHVRVYGRDYTDRLRDAGFAVEVIPFAALLGPQMVARCGLDTAEDVYHCRKARPLK